MTDIQEMIISLEKKIKDQTERLNMLETETAGLKSLLFNDIKCLEKIIDSVRIQYPEE